MESTTPTLPNPKCNIGSTEEKYPRVVCMVLNCLFSPEYTITEQPNPSVFFPDPSSLILIKWPSVCVIFLYIVAGEFSLLTTTSINPSPSKSAYAMPCEKSGSLNPASGGNLVKCRFPSLLYITLGIGVEGR